MNITAKYLTKVFDGGVYALNGFSAEIQSGSAVSVLGESGCGKTTLLRLLSGLENPSSGELYFDGVLYKDCPMKTRDTAVVFQDYILYPRMTVWENVETALERYDLPREESEARVRAVLSDLGLLRFKNQLPRYLSGGQQQRVAIARAIVRDPSLLLFDEPLSNIAQEQRDEYIKLISEVRERLPKSTIVYVTHNPREAMIVGDYLLIMNEGKCIQFGKKERVWKYPYSLDVALTISAEPKTIAGAVKGGSFTGYDDLSSPFPVRADSQPLSINFDTDYEGEATLLYNSYDNDSPVLFDEKGDALTGEKDTVYLSGVFDGKTVKFGGTAFTPDEDFKQRFFGDYGVVKVGIKSIAFRTKPKPYDIELSATKEGDEYTVNGEKFTLFLTGFTDKLYVSPSDVELFDAQTGGRVLAHYRVYKEIGEGVAKGGVLKVPSGVIPVDGGISGKVKFSFNRKHVTAIKKGGIKAICLDEEEISANEKLVYCSIKGFTNYVTLHSGVDQTFLDKKKLRIAIAHGGVTVKK